MRCAVARVLVRERRRRRIWRAACQSAIQNCTMTGSPFRRLQGLADEVRSGSGACSRATKEANLAGSPLRRLQVARSECKSKVVMKSRARIPRFNRDIVILAWQTWARELFHRHRLRHSCGCTASKAVPSPFRLTVTV
jgi:hypothetical protein